MGRIIYGGGYNPNAIEPPEPEWDFTVECPACGCELHEGDTVYQIKTQKGGYKIIACENCIDNLATFVEDL